MSLLSAAPLPRVRQLRGEEQQLWKNRNVKGSSRRFPGETRVSEAFLTGDGYIMPPPVHLATQSEVTLKSCIWSLKVIWIVFSILFQIFGIRLRVELRCCFFIDNFGQVHLRTSFSHLSNGSKYQLAGSVWGLNNIMHSMSPLCFLNVGWRALPAMCGNFPNEVVPCAVVTLPHHLHWLRVIQCLECMLQLIYFFWRMICW